MCSNGASNKCKPPTASYRPTTARKMAIVLHLRLRDGSPSTTESPRRRRLSATCPVPACLLRRRLPHRPHRRHLHCLRRHRHPSRQRRPIPRLLHRRSRHLHCLRRRHPILLQSPSEPTEATAAAFDAAAIAASPSPPPSSPHHHRRHPPLCPRPSLRHRWHHRLHRRSLRCYLQMVH